MTLHFMKIMRLYYRIKMQIKRFAPVCLCIQTVHTFKSALIFA